MAIPWPSSILSHSFGRSAARRQKALTFSESLQRLRTVEGRPPRHRLRGVREAALSGVPAHQRSHSGGVRPRNVRGAHLPQRVDAFFFSPISFLYHKKLVPTRIFRFLKRKENTQGESSRHVNLSQTPVGPVGPLRHPPPPISRGRFVRFVPHRIILYCN